MNSRNRAYCQGCRFWDTAADECGWNGEITDIDKMPRTRATGKTHTCPCRKPKTYTASHKGRKVQVTIPQD